MRRTLTAIVVVAASAIPASASAASGWALPAIASTHGNTIDTSYGRHCGSSMFGTYHMHGGSTVNGAQSAWTFNLDITQDGVLHHITALRFSRYTSAAVRRQVRAIFAATRYHYINSGGVGYLQGIWHHGQQQELQPFNPTPDASACTSGSGSGVTTVR